MRHRQNRLRARPWLLAVLLLFAGVTTAHAATYTLSIRVKFGENWKVTLRASCRSGSSKRTHEPINIETAILKPVGYPIPGLTLTDPSGMPLPDITFTAPPTVGGATDVQQLRPAPPGYEWVQWVSDLYAPPDGPGSLDFLMLLTFPPGSSPYCPPGAWLSDNGDVLYGQQVVDGWGESLPFHGLLVATSGNAGLTPQPGTVIVSNIGSSGLDGFTAVPGPGEGIRTNLPGPAAWGALGQDLEQARVEVDGGVHGDLMTTYSLGLQLTQTASGFDYGIDAPLSVWTSPTASVWSGDTKVVDLPGAMAASLDHSPDEIEAEVHGGRGDDKLLVKLRFDAPFTGTIDGLPVAGDGILLVYSAELDMPAHVDELSVQGTCALVSGTCSMALDTADARWNRRRHQALGSALIQGQCVGPQCQGENFVVANIGSSGLDGVVIDARPGETAIIAEFPDPNPFAPLPDASYLELGARGSIEGGPDQFLGYNRLTRSGASYELTADYSPIGSATQTVLVYDGARLVAEFPGMSGVLATAPELNFGCGKPWEIPWLAPPAGTTPPAGKVTGPLLCFWWKWKNRQTFDIPGKAPVVGDALWVISEGSPVYGELSSVSLEGNDLPEGRMILRRENNGARVGDFLVKSLGDGVLQPGTTPQIGEESFLSTTDVSVVRIGSAGLDGFTVPVDSSDRIWLDWEAVHLPPSVVDVPQGTFRFEGPSSTDPTQVVGVELLAHEDGSDLVLSVDASEIGASTVSVTVYNGNSIVLAQNSASALSSSVRAASQMALHEIMVWNGSGINLSIDFPDPVSVKPDTIPPAPGGSSGNPKRSVLGDRIVFTAAGATNAMTSYLDATVTTANVSEVKLHGISTTVTTDTPPVATIHRVILDPPHPNPFNPATTISFSLDRTTRVGLRVFTLAGRRVRTLRSGVLPPGPHAVRWDGRDERGLLVASGSYLVELRTGTTSMSRKITLMK